MADQSTMPQSSATLIIDKNAGDNNQQSAFSQRPSRKESGFSSPRTSMPNQKPIESNVGVRIDNVTLNQGVSKSRHTGWRTLTPINRIISSVLEEPLELHDSSPRPWKVSLMRFGPLSGIFCMLLAICSIFASLGILAASRGAPVDTWVGTPPIYLAICTAIANLAMRYACIQGVLITWWTRALSGSSIAKLHNDWRAGTSLRGALASGRNMGLLALACIFSTIVVVDGPLLQRASTVRLVPVVARPVRLNVQICQEIPTDYSGFWTTAKEAGLGRLWEDSFNRSSIPTAVNGTGPNNIISTTNLSPLKKFWADKWVFENDALAPDFISGCPGICQARIRAPALAMTACRSFLTPVNYTQQTNGEAYTGDVDAAPLTLDAFIIDISLQLHGHESIDLVTGYASNTKGIGTLNVTACNMESAVGEYEVLITNHPPAVTSTWTPRIVALANNTQVNYKSIIQSRYRPSTFGGIVAEAYSKWASRVSYWTETNGMPYGWVYGFFAQDLFSVKHAEFDSFADPHKGVLSDLNKLMFITGLFAARNENASSLRSTLDPGLPINSSVTGNVEGEQNVFHTDFHWFIAAAIVEFGCILLVLPTYWGWWKLGRPVSFSPIEIAKAFESPILADCNSNSSGRDITKRIGETSLQYGATKNPEKKTMLAFVSSESVERPTKNSIFDV